ncbi:Tn3 family transposase [Streptomyces sp. RG80]|uniref:Tn3 family transposase n=1 Tax=Streptomyces sp. RG80 TaxID=3157340 RepID=UPI00338D7677
MTDAVIFHTTLGKMSVLRQLAAEGWEIKPEDLAAPAPYQTMRINRFGVYATDKITITPDRNGSPLTGGARRTAPWTTSGSGSRRSSGLIATAAATLLDNPVQNHLGFLLFSPQRSCGHRTGLVRACRPATPRRRLGR